MAHTLNCAACGKPKRVNKIGPFRCMKKGCLKWNKVSYGINASRKVKVNNSKKKKRILTPREALFINCDKLWFKLVKDLAGWKSELSGRTKEGGFVLQAHHIFGKSNYHLRFSLLNGICITKGEHFRGFHKESLREKYWGYVKYLRGNDIFDKLKILKHTTRPADLSMVWIYLNEEAKKLKEAA